MAVFQGAGVAIITPFHEDGSVNYEKFTEIIEEQIAGGTDAIIVCGTTGEAATLTHEEHLDVIRHCVKAVNGRIPVVAGTGSNCTETAVYLSQEAEKIGADALLVVTPYYNKATQNGLFAHFKKVADSVKLPIILYNVPSRTGCNIQPQTLVKLCCQKFFDGDVEGSMKEQLRAIELIDALFCEVNPIPVKTALNLMGKEVGPLHMPLSPMEPQNVERLKTAMKNYGIL